MTKDSITITGATGGIGRSLANEAARRGHRVCGVARRIPADAGENIKWARSDLTSTDPGLDAILDGTDVVIHCAASIAASPSQRAEEMELWQINVLAMRELVESMARQKVGHLVLASTGNLYAPDLTKATETSKVEPRSRVPYLASKAAQEWFTASLCTEHNVGLSIMRISSVYGDGRNVVDQMARRLIAGEQVTLENGGHFGADFVHRDDVVAALLLAAEKRLRGTFNVSGGRRSLLKDVAMELAKLAGTGIGSVVVAAQDDAPDHGFPAINSDRLQVEDFLPRPVSQGLADIVAALRERAEQI